LTNSIDIRPQDLAIVQRIVQNTLPQGVHIWVFGSRAQGTAKKASDLDLAVDAGRPLMPSEVTALADAFEESDLPYTVDVVDMQTVNERFLKIIDEAKLPLPTIAPATK
jgi:predicted nucleotidyltransferase